MVVAEVVLVVEIWQPMDRYAICACNVLLAQHLLENCYCVWRMVFNDDYLIEHGLDNSYSILTTCTYVIL